MEKRHKLRLYELGLPLDIVELAKECPTFPSDATEGISVYIRGLEWQSICLQRYTGRQELLGRKVEVREKIQACRGLLSGIRHIPTEILGEIFEWLVLPGQGPTIRKQGKEDVPAGSLVVSGSIFRPETLRLVSRHWKDAADSTPTIWSNVTIKAVQKSWDNIPRLEDPTHEPSFLARVNRLTSLPWSLTVLCPVRSTPTAEERREECMTGEIKGTLLLPLLRGPAFDRLERFMISLGDNSFWVLNEFSFPNVTSAVIHCPRFGWGPDDEEKTTGYLPILPKLRDLVLDGEFLYEFDDIPTTIPWAQLTHLFLGNQLTNDQWKALFKLCVSLQRGCFKLSGYISEGGNQYSQPETAVFPHLTELAFLDGSPFVEPLGDISMPSLTKLQIITHYKSITVWDFDHRDLRNLTHLTLMSDTAVNGIDLRFILKTLPGLRELFFRIGESFEALFRFLTVEDGRCNLPFLEAVGMSVRPVSYEPTDYEESDADGHEYDDSSDDDQSALGESEGDWSDEGDSDSEVSGEGSEDSWENNEIVEGIGAGPESEEGSETEDSEDSSSQSGDGSDENEDRVKVGDKEEEESEEDSLSDSEDEMEMPRSRARWDDDEPRRQPQWGDWDYDPTPWAGEEYNHYPDESGFGYPGESLASFWHDRLNRANTPPSTVFDYQSLATFAASRLPETPSMNGVSRLKHLVVRVEDIYDDVVDVDEIVRDIRKVLEPLASRGLRTEVSVADGPQGDEDSVGGYSMRGYKHWDEGFMDFLDDEAKLRLYPKKGKAT
ncbi:hypothetical protein D9611_002954 [Ephemerocybe angulata]|uniref:F-box domain-containing protein n=1 Tax=Ephemerocybe angulata TaxID=980116 RepID=A0A8H5FHE3_9AGAR|nr:hypothetical protein D9611_002954 [Tulosesus angulatus]